MEEEYYQDDYATQAQAEAEWQDQQAADEEAAYLASESARAEAEANMEYDQQRPHSGLQDGSGEQEVA